MQHPVCKISNFYSCQINVMSKIAIFIWNVVEWKLKVAENGNTLIKYLKLYLSFVLE